MNPRFFPATEDYGHYEELLGEPGERLFPEHPLEPDFSEGGPPGRPKPGAGVPDFLPSAQRALYLRIQQKQQEEEERARRLAESSKQDRENEEGTCPPQGQGLPLAGTAPRAAVQGSGERLGWASHQGVPLPGATSRAGPLRVPRKPEVRTALLCLRLGEALNPTKEGGGLAAAGDSGWQDLPPVPLQRRGSPGEKPVQELLIDINQ